jgi:trimeric autotransporter adhesin
MAINQTFTETPPARRALALFSGLTVAFALLLLLGLQSAEPAHAATRLPVIVNSTGDENDLDFPGGVFDGSSDNRCDVNAATAGRQCTLRAAIQAANDRTGADAINFNIPGNGPHTITPTTVLPQITGSVTVDGYTQGDSSTGTTADDATENTLAQGTNANLKIVLHGDTATNYCHGLNVAANNVVIRGLVINNFEFCGSANSSSAPGIRLSGAGHRVEGNFIGTNVDGTASASDRNARGVLLSDANDSTIGGTSPEDRNLISGNVRSGVEVSASSGNTIRNNLIGPDKNGNPLPDSNAVDGGVVITSSTGNRILSNSIFSNGDLGIDLEGGVESLGGVTDNDPKDPDTGPNRLQNYPVITSAQTFASFTSVNGTLDSTPSTRKKTRTFIIQFFSSAEDDPSHFGEGQTFLGQKQVQTNRQGNASFSFAPSEEVPVGRFITVTATRKDTGDTSEFSRARIVEEPVIGS